MLQDNTIDPRIVANAFVEHYLTDALPLTHIALQKLVYFAHGTHLIRHGTPLVSGFFEAWTYGPVHQAVYSAFRNNGAAPIHEIAKGRDLRTGGFTLLPKLTEKTALNTLMHILGAYGSLSASQLVALSHAKGGPWERVYAAAKGRRALGLRISNELISSHFQRHKLSSCDWLSAGEVDGEDTPIAHYRFG